MSINKLLILTFINLFILNISTIFAWSYPFKYIAKPGCRFEIWKNLGPDCKIPLPKIKNANYKKYKNNISYRLIYSVLWTATYKNGWDIGYGSHQGVDIATSLGTPVYSIGDGIVTVAGYLRGRGNTVVIKHYLGNGKYIRSVYAHLNKIFVKKGQKIKEGTKIGEVGHSGYAWGNHLHFQIDINQRGFHPYYPTNCPGSPSKIVNLGLCKDKIIENTIDPIYFLENNGAKILKVSSEPKIKTLTKKIVEKEKISPKTIIPREKLLLTELELFLARYKINIKSLIPANVIYLGKTGYLKIIVKKKNGKKFSGILPQPIDITSLKKNIIIIPSQIRYIDNGERLIKIFPKKIGNDVITIKIGKKTLKQIPIRIISKNYKIKPYHGFFWIETNHPHLGDEIWGLAVLQDKDYANIIKVPFIGTYYLKVKNGLICPIKININQLKYLKNFKCTNDKLTNKYQFTYKDTLLGILLFKIIPTKLNSKISLYITDNKGKIISSKTLFYPTKLPLDFSKTSIWTNLHYLPYVEKSLKNLLTRNYKIGKFIPDFKLKKSTAINWIKNLKYKIYHNTRLKYFPKENFYITRLEFLKTISINLNLYSKINKKIFWDVPPEMYKYTNLLNEINGYFLDRFGNKFFQPNKTITRQEAAYLLEKTFEYLIYKNKHSY